MLKAAFLHDTDADNQGGAELSNKAILDVSEQHGVTTVYDNLTDFRKTKQLIRDSDFVIINSTVRCEYEFLLIDFLTTSGKPYIKWEHDYNFCATRNAMCFVDRKVKGCCNGERFTAYRKLFVHAQLSVFVSPRHYQIHEEIYGEAIRHYLVLPQAIDLANIQSLPKKKDSVCFVGNLNQQKGGHQLVEFAYEQPHLQIDVYGEDAIGLELPPNVTLKGKRPNKEMLRILAETEYFFFKPVWLQPGGRVAAEAFLSGCKTITNGNIGFHSHPFYPAYPEEAKAAMQNAPHLFWKDVKEAIKSKEEKHRWKNVLVYKSFGGLGDFLFTIPALQKIASVSERITVCVPFGLYGLLKKQLTDYEIFPEDYINTANLAEYDKVIDLKNYPSYRKDTSNNHQMGFPSYRRLNQHAYRHYLDGVATLHPDIDNSCESFPYLKSAANTKGKYFTVHPGAGFEAKYWPAEKYGRLIQMLLDLFEDIECKLILGPSDPKVETLFQHIPARVSIPKGNLEVIADVISGALFHIGNDSGMTHLAGAFNVPTITIHGPTGPGTWMSFAEHKEVIWGKQGVCNIPCNYEVAVNCAHRICLNSVTPQRVMKHALKLLQNILPVQKEYRFIFSPEAEVQRYADSFVLKIKEKELLVEFANDAERHVFEKLIENNPHPEKFSDSFERLIDLLIENELLFRIPGLPAVISSIKKEQVDVTIVSHIKKRDGIGRLGILFAEMLDGSFSINGIATREPSADDIAPSLYNKLTHRKTTGRLAILTDVLHQNNKINPYIHVPREAEIKVCYSMFESSAIPEEWVSIINGNFDRVLVPDAWLVDVYKSSGVEKPVHVLPLACYLQDFLNYPLKRKSNDAFTFGTSAGIWMRKNILGVVDAFKLAFPDGNEKVKLRIHSRNGFGPEAKRIKNAINGDSRIEFFIAPLSDAGYLQFMTSLDAYVLLSMGEGFSITPREAMALGLPVVLSDNTAQRIICETGLVYPVPTKNEIPGYYETFNKVHGNFFMPDLLVAAELMQNLFRDRESIYNDAQKRRQWAAQYDVANMKALYTDTIARILNGQSLTPSPKATASSSQLL